MPKSKQIRKAQELHRLHEPGNFLILPNIWEPLGAALLQKSGYGVVATSSSAVALTHGYLDGEKMPFNDVITQLKRIVDAVDIPVTADIECAYASNNRELEENIEIFLETGIVGINFEDTDKKTATLLPAEEQARKIEIIRDVAARKNIPLFINARIDTYLPSANIEPEHRLQETIHRAELYTEAGAHCVFPILLRDIEQIKLLTKAVVLPVNIMAMAGTPTFEQLKRSGVRRVSLGSSFLKLAMQEMQRFALLAKQGNGMEDINKNLVDSAFLEGLMG